MRDIDKTTIVHPDAVIGNNVTIGPYSHIKENVIIGDGCEIGSHVVLTPGTRLGKDCQVFHHAVLGEIPQDLKFGGESSTLEIGDRTVIREFVTMNRGTKVHDKTEIGSDCLMMAYVHVAHDCIIGNNVILANAVNLGGHVEIEDWVTVGGMSPIHQFVSIGQHSFIGGGYRVTKDVPPYILAAGEPLKYSGLNSIGLRRRGFSNDTILALKRAYAVIYHSEYNVSDAVKKIEGDGNLICEVRKVLSFIKESQRGII